MKITKKVFFIICLCSSIHAVSKFDEVLIPCGVRSVGCGGNFVTVYDSAEGLFYNPAIAGLSDSGELVLAHHLYFLGSTLEQFAVCLPLGIINFGLTGKMFTSPEIDEIYNFNFTATGKKFKLDTKLANLSTAFRISKNLSFGFGGKYVSQQLSKLTSSAILYDFGIIFTTNDELLTFGYSLVNYTSDDKLNLAKHNTGVRLKFDLPSQDTKINILASAEIDYYSSEPVYSFAIEHWGSNILGLRIGYIYDTKKKDLGIFDQFSFFTAGLSLRIGNFGIDYAYLPNSLLGTTHNIGVSLKFMSRKKEQRIKETLLPCELTAEPQYFSPNNDGYLDNIFFRHNISTYTNIVELSYTITDTNNATVFVFKSTCGPIDSFYTYDGKDLSGNTLTDGEYFVELLAKDKTENAMLVYKSKKVNFVVDTSPALVEISLSTDVYSPDSGNLEFNVTVKDEHSYINTIDLGIFTAQDKKVYSFVVDLTEKNNIFEKTFTWDGKDEIYNETVPNGEYKIKCKVSDAAGNRTTKEVTFKVYLPPKQPEKVVEKQEKLFYIQGAKVTLDPRGIVVTYPTDELFVKETGEINPKFYDSLSSLAEIIKESFADKKIFIEGHTDSVGDAEENKKKSSRHAWTVYSHFVKVLGLDGKQFEVKGWGEEKPVASNKSKLGRYQNRRIEIIISK